MKITLKNIKHTEWASEETHCYQATLYVDGKKVGHVSNDGHGGCDRQYFNNPADRKRIDDYCATLPEIPYGFAEGSYRQDLESICGELVTEHLYAKDMQRSLRSKVLFTLDGKAGIRQIGWKGTRKVDARHIHAVKEKYPEATILNTLPTAEALKVYRANA